MPRAACGPKEEFGDIILKTGSDGQIVRLSDVARLELGAGDYTLRSQLDGKNAVGIGIFQAPGANALEIRDKVIAQMDELTQRFPDDVKYEAVYDTTIFVRDSISAVVHTLLEAILLVVLVVILFLQTWRASIIPLIAVPVSVVGTFGALYLLGFSINTLTLFGLVLAIGIVVDDAIVVVENVERNIEEGLTPLAAARRPCARSPDRSSPLPWCCARCSCRWHSCPASPASSTSSSRSPSRSPR